MAPKEPTKSEQEIIERFKHLETAEFKPSESDLAFLKAATGIEDEQTLKLHVVSVQQKALKIFPYACITVYTFVETNISKVAGFEKALQIAKKDPSAFMFDAGSCFGADGRQAVIKGFPATQIVASDIHPEFWDLGHELFRDDQESMPITFIGGDVFDEAFLTIPARGQPISTTQLSEITSLTDLHGRLTAIHASKFFHLFAREKQEQLARLLGSLLKLEKGSVLFGHQMGAQEEGIGKDKGLWAHNCESWKALWEETLPELGWTGSLHVEAYLEEAPAFLQAAGLGTHWLYWTVELV